MLIRHLLQKLAFHVEFLDDERISVLNKETCELFALLRKRTVFFYELYERKIIVTADSCVVFTECRGDMNDTGTVAHGYIAVCTDFKGFFSALFYCSRRIREQGFVLLADELRSLISLEDLILIEKLRNEASCHVVHDLLLCAVEVLGNSDLYIFIRRADAEGNVGRKCPRCSCPCGKVSILFTDDLKTYEYGVFFYGLISLGNFVARKRSTAARAVRNDLVALIEHSLIP